MVYRWVRDPSLARPLQVGFHATPLVPLQEAICANEKKSDHDKDDGANLSNLDEIVSEIIYDRCVHLVTELNGVLCRDWKRVGIEGETEERVVDVLLQELEGRVNAADYMSLASAIRIKNEGDIHVLDLVL